MTYPQNPFLIIKAPMLPQFEIFGGRLIVAHRKTGLRLGTWGDGGDGTYTRSFRL